MRANVTLDEDSFEDAFAELEAHLDAITRGIIVTFWEKVLLETPQYQGRMAASWNFTVGSPYGVDRSNMVSFDPGKDDPRQKGHIEGIEIADSYARDTINNFYLGQNAWMTNGVDHGEGMYAMDMEESRIKVRYVNMPGTMVMQGLSMIESMYSRGVSVTQAQELMRKKL